MMKPVLGSKPKNSLKAGHEVGISSVTSVTPAKSRARGLKSVTRSSRSVTLPGTLAAMRLVASTMSFSAIMRTWSKRYAMSLCT